MSKELFAYTMSYSILWMMAVDSIRQLRKTQFTIVCSSQFLLQIIFQLLGTLCS